MDYHIHPIPALKDNYIWLLANPDNHQALVVDPGESEPVVAYLKAQQLNLVAILITHHHGDHTNGAQALKQQYDIPVYGSADNQHPSITQKLNHLDNLNIPSLQLTFQCIAIPGHTLDHMAFYSNPYAFTGDTLFSAGCGRVFEGTPAQMFASLERLLALPDDTKIYCGHEYTLSNLAFAQAVEPDNQAIVSYQSQVESLRQQDLPSLPSTMALEKRVNPFLRVHEPQVIRAASQHVGQALTEPAEVFAALRQWKNNL